VPTRTRALRGLALLVAIALPGAAAARDRGADGVFERRTSSHFELYEDVDIDHWSGPDGTRAFETAVLDVLENAYDRVAKILDLRPAGRQRVVVYDAADFDARFARSFGFRAAGFFDGAIHVRGGVQVDARLARTLHHEYVHSALAASVPAHALPAWVNEGLAEWFENLAVGKRALSAGEAAFLADAARRGLLGPLAALGGASFAHQDGATAAVSYVHAYAALDHLARRKGDRGLRDFVRTLVRTRDVEAALRRVYSLDTASLDAALRADFG
jgi:hypothetical protein